MPIIGISVKHLNTLLKTSLAPEVLQTSLEKLGCEADEIGDVALYECPACKISSEKLLHEEAPKKCTICGYEAEEAFVASGTDQVIRLDLLPARPDLFDVGGIARALKGYLGIETGLPEYPVAGPQLTVEVDANLRQAQSFRPFIGCAVVTMPPIDAYLLRVLMKMQESLHWGIGRDRKLASIGIYDLDTITPPITYKAVAPDSLRFTPLGYPNARMTPAEILAKHPKGIAYAHLLQALAAYPLLVDSKGQVLSMPPIINSDETKVKLGTTRLFIDVTGVTASDVTKSLHTLVTSLVEIGGKAQAVTIHSAEGEKVTPELSAKEITIHLHSAEKWLGFEIKSKDLLGYLAKMRLHGHGRGNVYQVQYPAFRTDIKHEVDIFEDIVIAYGFENLPLKLVSTMTVGAERPEEKTSQVVRQIMLGLGFTEIFSLMLTTEPSHFSKFNAQPGSDHAVILNPKVADHNIVRCHLMTGLLDCLVKNRLKATPQRYFEIGNVLRCVGEDKIPKEERHVCFVIMGPKTGYAEVRGVLDAVLKEFRQKGQYQSITHPTFITGRVAEVTTNEVFRANLGELHPQVLENFGLSLPVALCELTLAKVL